MRKRMQSTNRLVAGEALSDESQEVSAYHP